MTQRASHSAVKAMLFGAVAGVAGTTAMDVVNFAQYRQGGGTQKLTAWETAQGIDRWDNASAPGKFGKRLIAGVTGSELPDRWARSMTNLVHWTTGVGWGAQFGLVRRSSRHRWTLALLLGPTVWLSGYVILPLAKVYKPIWEYDGATLAKDLGTHTVYGLVTAATFAGLTHSITGAMTPT